MVRLFLRLVLAILLVRFVGGLFKAVAGGSPPRARMNPQPPRSLVDRASVIDVPFTEEHQEG